MSSFTYQDLQKAIDKLKQLKIPPEVRWSQHAPTGEFYKIDTSNLGPPYMPTKIIIAGYVPVDEPHELWK